VQGRYARCSGVTCAKRAKSASGVTAAGLAFDRGALARLSAGHLCADMCQGAVPALFPFLITERGLSFAATSGLLVTMTVCSSVLQPIFGVISDRTTRSFFMPLGLVLAGVGVAICGISASYPVQLVAVAVGGLGVGLFHPDGARRARVAAGAKVGTGFSFFSVGGNAGFAVAPALVTPAVLLFGLEGAAVVLVPCLVVATILALRPPPLSREHPDGAATAPPEADRWGAFARIGGIAALRSGVYFGLQAFMAGYFVTTLHTSDGAANAALTAMLACGALGTLAGGRLADRVDPRLVLFGSAVLQLPLIALLLMVDTVALGAAVAALLGFVTVGTFSATVVMGQGYLPSRPGLASGVTLGLAIGIGGLIAALLGPVADAHGPGTAIWILAALPVPTAILAASLPYLAGMGSTPRFRRAAQAVAEPR
jgi:MFS transporter, FSR family, fosmidomycin resistance protein